MIREEINQTAVGEFVKSSPESGSQNFHPTAGFVGFAGHFPDYPIMPAMLQILFGIIVAEKVLDTVLVMKKLDRAKFMVQIKPDEIITVSCRISRPADHESEIQAKSTIMAAEKKVATMTLWLEPAST
jgi:3-hydroxyacyl-[acyl-carrier-protein] dehydratase